MHQISELALCRACSVSGFRGCPSGVCSLAHVRVCVCIYLCMYVYTHASLAPTQHERAIVSESKGKGLHERVQLSAMPSQPGVCVTIYHQVSPLAGISAQAPRPRLRKLQGPNCFRHAVGGLRFSRSQTAPQR